MDDSLLWLVGFSWVGIAVEFRTYACLGPLFIQQYFVCFQALMASRFAVANVDMTIFCHFFFLAIRAQMFALLNITYRQK